MSDFSRYSHDEPRCGAGAVLLFILVVAISAGAFALTAVARSDAGARITYIDEQRPWSTTAQAGAVATASAEPADLSARR